MSKGKSLSDIRREYGELTLSEENLWSSPIEQFNSWLAEVMQANSMDPTAMVLSTVDENGFPDSRVVLLKGIVKGHFIFYTNYQSAKALQILQNPFVALNFYWPHMARQVRVRGRAEQTDAAQSDKYFASRPLANQYSAIASPQSQKIKSRSEIEQKINALISQNQPNSLVRPSYWGGYKVIPHEFEFWQGRDNRLHDRIHYYQKNDKWYFNRLAP